MYTYGDMGVKRCVKTSGMQIKIVKQLVNKFNGSKFQNTDFGNLTLYFLKFPLYNVSGKCYVDICPMNYIFMFLCFTIIKDT